MLHGEIKASSLFGTYEPKDFFNTGTNIQNNVSLSVGNEKNQTYLSVGTTNATGIIQIANMTVTILPSEIQQNS